MTVTATGGEALVESLIANGVDTVFGVPGAQLDPIFAALHDRRDRIRLIHARHEQGASFMAFGYAEAGGKIGTLLVVPGPGLLNAGSGIATGYARNTPMLCLVGQGSSQLIGRGFGVLHEIPDQLGVARGLVDWAESVGATEQIPERIVAAIERFSSGRTRPVYLDLPLDLTQQAADFGEFPTAKPCPLRPEADAGAIEAAAAALLGAECPLVMVGGGGRAAAAEIRALAERLNAPVAMTFNALGTMDSRHPLAFTPLGAHHWWARADVVLALGTRLFPAGLRWGRDRNLEIIKVDHDADELHRLPPPIRAVHADVGAFVTALRAEIERRAKKPVPDRSAVREEVRRAVEAELASVAPQRELLSIVREEIGEDGILVADVTQLYFVAPDAMPVYRPRTFIHASYQGTLGHAVATAIGAQVAMPDRPVLALAGDGGFMFTVQELATAVHFGVPVTFLVMNDGAYGNVRRMLTEDYGNRDIGTDLTNPDFVKLAESFGMPGRRAADPAGLRAALRNSLAEPGPALVEYRAPEFPSPWPLYFRPPVRGA